MNITEDEAYSAACRGAARYSEALDRAKYKMGFLDAFEWMQQKLQQTHVSGSLPCDHSAWVRYEDEDHSIVTQCQKCGEVRRQ